MQNKDVIYIESDSSIPFISFGSRAARNLIVKYTSISEDSDVERRIDQVNRAIIPFTAIPEIEELVARMGGIFRIERVDSGSSERTGYNDTFFDEENTKALMEAWDE